MTKTTAPTPPPAIVRLSDVLDDVTEASEVSPVLGVGADGQVVTVPLDQHVLVCSAAGGGSSTIVRALLAQVLRQSGTASIIDRKRHSHGWAKGLPGVAYWRDLAEIHTGLFHLGQVATHRAKVQAGETITIVDPRSASDKWAVPPIGSRHVVVIEEANATIGKLRQLWGDNDEPAPSPAIEALTQLLYVGRQVNMVVLVVTHGTSVTTLDPEMRAQFGTVILGRYTHEQAQTVAPEVELPRSARHIGRAQVVQNGQAHETQVLFFTDDEARAWASGLTVETCPYCGESFRAPAGHDPLKGHVDYCEKRPPDANDV